MRKKNKFFMFLFSTSFMFTAHAAEKVGLTIYNGEDPFVASIRKPLETAIRKQNVELITYDSQNSQAKQNAQIDDLIARGVKTLIVNLVDPEAGLEIVSKAKEANIPVVFFNKDPGRQIINHYQKAYYIGADPVQSAMIQGDLIAKGWRRNPNWDINGDGKIQFVLLKGEEGHPDSQARSEWVVKELLQNNIPIEKLSEAYGNWDEEKGKEITNAWLKGPKGNQIEVIIANNDSMAIGARQAVQDNGRDIPIYGIDAIPRALLMVDNGELAGTVLNDGLSQARAISQITPSLMLGSEPDEYTGYHFDDRYLRIPYIAVDKTNLHRFLNH